MSRKLIKEIYVAADDPNQPDLDDIIFTVLEEYGEGFLKWLGRNIDYDPDNGIYYHCIGMDQRKITFPEVIQEYRKYVSQQNMKP